MNLQSIMAAIAALIETAKTQPWAAYEADAVIVLNEIETSPYVPATMVPYLTGLVQAIRLLEKFTPSAVAAKGV